MADTHWCSVSCRMPPDVFACCLCMTCTDCCVSSRQAKLAVVLTWSNRPKISFHSLSLSLSFTCTDCTLMANVYTPLFSFSPLYRTMSLRTAAVGPLSASASLSPSPTPLVPRPAQAPPSAATPRASLTRRSRSLLRKRTHRRRRSSQNERTPSQKSI